MSRLNRLLLTCLLGVLGFATLVYGGDWATLHVREMRGSAFGTIHVERFLVTSLKGGKAEYDYLGEDDVTCSRSMFPQAGHNPCWYVEKHKSDWVLN